MSDNHVSVFLLLEGNQGAVRLNMRTEESDPTGVLVWSEEPYQLSNSQTTHYDYQLRYTMQVSALYAWIRSWGLQRNVFSGGGSSCRFWVCVPCIALRFLLISNRYTLLMKLKEVNYLVDGLPQDAWSKLSWQYFREVPPRQIQIIEGTWLSQKQWED